MSEISVSLNKEFDRIMNQKDKFLCKFKDRIILIYELFINKSKVEFYVCEGKRMLDVYLISDENSKVQKLNIKGGEHVLEQYLFSINSYCMYNWFPQESKTRKSILSVITK